MSKKLSTAQPPPDRVSVVCPGLGIPKSVPAVELLRKQRIGSPRKRVYDTPQTPLDRLRARPETDCVALAELFRLRATTDPFVLAMTIEKKLDRIAGLGSHQDPSRRVTSQTA